MLELNSHSEKKVIWVPYVCMQIRDPVCYGDLDNPTDPAGKLVAEGKAKPLSLRDR